MGLFGKRDHNTEHRYAGERLSAYLDAQLPAKEKDRVERHLATCERCRWELDTLRQSVSWTRQLPCPSVPRLFTVPVPARAARAPQKVWGLPALQGATGLVAVLFFLAAAGQAFYPRFMTASAPQPGVAAARNLSSSDATQPPLAESIVVEATAEVELDAQGAGEATAANAVALQSVSESPSPVGTPTPESAGMNAIVTGTPPTGVGGGPPDPSVSSTLTAEAAEVTASGAGETSPPPASVQAEPTAEAALKAIPAEGLAPSLTQEEQSALSELGESAPSDETLTADAAVAGSAPTEVALAEGARQASEAAEAPGSSSPLRQAPAWWSGVVIGLGVVLVLLGAATLYAMLRLPHRS